MPHILDSLWTMLTAGDLLGALGGLLSLLLAVVLAPFAWIANVLGIS